MQQLTSHQLAALNSKKSISLTANAGSGKTYVLAKRYLEIVLNNDIPLQKIAAITFTDKAAGELYKKIAGEIDILQSQNVNAEKRLKLISVRRQLVSAKISTIHSFCIDILREFPVEAQLDANFLPIDEIVSSELIELSTEQIINEILNSSSAENVKILIRLFGSKYKLAEVLRKLISQRKNVLELSGNLYNKSEDEITKYFQESFISLTGEILSKEKINFQNSLESVNKIVLDNYPENEIALQAVSLITNFKKETSVTGLLSFINKLNKLICTADGTIRTKGYIGKSKEQAPVDLISYLENFFSDFSGIPASEKSELDFELASYGKLIIELFKSVLSRYETIKQDNGFLDFEDILLKTKRILENDNVRRQLVEKFNYLLVDEYQDTNEIQYQIFIPIVDYLKSNNLFVVGDEKQSIYRFRDAELEIFNQTKRMINDSEGKGSTLTLPDSFRMSPSICLFTNILFKQLFNNPVEMFNEVEHSDIICATENDFEGRIEFLLANQKEDYAEAELIAKRILQLFDDNADQVKKWNDIAILVRKRSSFDELEKIFIKYKIPYTIVGGKGFFQRQIIYDVYNYFSFLQNCENDTAMTGILRSPFFNVSDVKILELSLQQGNTFYQKLKYSVKESLYWKKIYDRLVENLELAVRLELPVMLRKILSESSFLSVIASRENRKQELRNIEKLIKLTIDFSNEGFNSLYDYVNYLGDAINKLEDVSQASVEKENEGVNILTIHQSKGLEYPAVFLYNCHDKSQTSIIKAREISINKKYGLLTKIPENKNYFGEYKSAPIVSVCNLIEDKKDLAEIKRLLYVGVTRAKSFLFFSSVSAEKNFPERSFMNLVQSGLGCDFNSAHIELSGKLVYLKKDNHQFKNYEKSLTINIPITREIKTETALTSSEITESNISSFNYNKISDSQSGEIISASKFMVYSQCPVKYNLMYKLGLSSDIFKWSAENYRAVEISDSKQELDNQNSLYSTDNLFNYSKSSIIKGRLIHSVLENVSDKLILREFILKEMQKFDLTNDKTINEEEIIDELEKFYDSSEHKYLNSFKNYRNEAEIYVYEPDYFLYGIIDKLIFDGNKLIVVDYKTDRIQDNSLEEKITLYKNQLLFYIYIASIKFSDFKEFEGRLIFTRQPDSPFVIRFNEELKTRVHLDLKRYISDERRNLFNPDKKHCPQCNFSFDKKDCVLEKAELVKSHLNKE